MKDYLVSPKWKIDINCLSPQNTENSFLTIEDANR